MRCFGSRSKPRLSPAFAEPPVDQGVKSVKACPPATPLKTATSATGDQLCSLSVRELKDLVRQGGDDPSAYLEKSELLAAARRAVGGATGLAGTSHSVPPGVVLSDRSTTPPSDATDASPFSTVEPTPWSQNGCAGQLPRDDLYGDTRDAKNAVLLSSGDQERVHRKEENQERVDIEEEEDEEEAEAAMAASAEAALRADPEDASDAVRRHCEAALTAAASRLARVWRELETKAAEQAPPASIATAIGVHNVFDLIDASLEAKRNGSPVPPRIHHLAFQASVAEEAWLVRKSILDAVIKANAADVELWAEQASVTGDDVSIELAFASMLRWSTAGGSNENASTDEVEASRGSKFDVIDLDADVGGDDGLAAPLRNSRPSVCRESMRVGGASAETTSSSDRWKCGDEIEEPTKPCAPAPTRAAAPYSAVGASLGRHSREAVGGDSALSFLIAGGTNPPVASAPYSAVGEAIGTHFREAAGGVAGSAHSRYDGFWQNGNARGTNEKQQHRGEETASESNPTKPSQYAYSGDHLGREDTAQASRYAGFWNTKLNASEQAGTNTDKAPNKDEKPPAPRPPRRTSWNPSAHLGRSSPQRDPEKSHKTSRQEAPGPSDGRSRDAGTEEDPATKDTTGPVRQTTQRHAATAPTHQRRFGGRRVRLQDFLMAKSCEPSFANEGISRNGGAFARDGFDEKNERSQSPRSTRTPVQQRYQAASTPPPPQQTTPKPTAPPQPQPTPPPPPPPQPAEATRTTQEQSTEARAPEARKHWWRRSKKSWPGRYYESRERAKEEWERTKERREKDDQRERAEQERERAEREQERAFFEEQSRRTRDKARSRTGSDGPSPASPPSSSGYGSASGGGRQHQRQEKKSSRARTNGGNSAVSGTTRRETYLDLLGFGPLAEPSAEELKQAYRKMAMRWHPDRPHNQSCAEEATKMFQAAKEAYDYFMEEHSRPS
eukprot:TRINITY_DN37690_c0_g1_i1.p1 TRINITY_DN37690_c0_g1~~TRINITY_DN37690_c0_g1_i1.p1  ORF type:complete len:954 (-),score=157.45 TRINITY_DN37690_c0_g1_i1:191-3052(-)